MKATGPSGGRQERPSAWIQDARFYGVDMARYSDTNDDGFGDLRGLTQKLDYLQGLGVTCLWLLPFFPSDRHDNGYDITDYLEVDPRFGDLEDFHTLTEEAHSRDMRVMLDIVVHHTSAKHPWFQAAQADPDSRYRDYYIWSEEKPPDDESKSIFPQEEDGIWDYSERAEAFYRHKFYHFEPDLRLANHEVWDAVKGILDFWISFGADAFRLDAATHFFDDKGVPGATASLGEQLDDLRGYLNERDPHIGLVGEADLPAEQLVPYLENGRFDLLYSFLTNNALFLSLARESAHPLVENLLRLRETAKVGAWLNFVRNVDELDLDQLTDEERGEVFDVFAPEGKMRIYGRGIRRGWPPMMKSDEQLHMTMSLLYALPGAPLIMYGQEIGMGDDLSREGRSTVRLPMQWNTERTGGFSPQGESGIARAAVAEGERGYERVNVREQQGDENSLLHLVRELNALRAKYPAVDKRDWRGEVHEESVVVLHYGDVVSLHNLSGHRKSVPALPGTRHLLGTDVSHGIPGYGFAWLHQEQKET